MNYAIVAAIIAAVLLVVRHLMAKARVDQIINSLPVDKENAQKFQTELERLNQEILDADLTYSNAKRKLNKPSNKSE